MAPVPKQLAGYTPLSAESGADMQSLLESFPEGVIFLDEAWRITFANASAREISRIAPEHLNGPSHWELYPATVGTEQERVYRRSMAERISLDHEFYYPPFDVWIALRTVPIPSGIAVHYRDISRLKRAEAKEESTLRQLHQVFEATSDSVVMLDRDYRIVFQNRRGKEVLSAGGDVLGMNLFEAFPGTVYEGSPYVEHYRRAMDERISGRFEAFYGEPFNFWLAVEAFPAEDGIIIFFRDITEQRAAAAELQRKTAEAEAQAAEIEAVYRTAPIGLALFDTEDFRYLRLNDRQAAFFGLKPEQVLGRTLTEMAPIPGLRELFEQVKAGTPVVNYPLEGELISHPGEHRYWTVNYTPVQGPDGTVQAISAASLEITAQKKAEKALIQSEKLAAVGRLASSISHEINNPLESVTNLLYLIAGHTDLPSEIRTYVELTQSEIARVSQIATQTLRFHRQTARPTRVTAWQMAEPVLRLFQGRLANSGIKVDMQFRSETQVLCLENEIRQVLSNLIGNAIDAMRTGGRLLLRAHDVLAESGQPSAIRITVADTGHGMSPEARKRIFEPFFTTKDLNGTGLGLWISAEIVERHRGSIRVRTSQHPRWHGTVFWLTLPLGE
jgi:PAS domain S-box-containing protein